MMHSRVDVGRDESLQYNILLNAVFVFLFFELFEILIGNDDHCFGEKKTIRQNETFVFVIRHCSEHRNICTVKKKSVTAYTEHFFVEIFGF